MAAPAGGSHPKFAVSLLGHYCGIVEVAAYDVRCLGEKMVKIYWRPPGVTVEGTWPRSTVSS